MRKLLAMAILGAGLMASGPASAQGWGVWFGGGNGNFGYHRPPDDDEGPARAVCSGWRAHALEDRLRHEVEEDDIDPDTAGRIHGAIDRLEDRQRHECAEGDQRAIWQISQRYDRIGQWIENEAHGEWQRGW